VSSAARLLGRLVWGGGSSTGLAMNGGHKRVAFT
jgi:hypothetical protein